MALDYEQDPELYGLRRSRRAHTAPKLYTESDEENEHAGGRRKRVEDDYDMNEFDENLDDDDDDDDEMDVDEDEGDEFDMSYGTEAGKGKGRSASRRMKTNKSGSLHSKGRKPNSNKKRKVNQTNGYDDEDNGVFGDATQIRFSTRNSRAVNYNIDQEDDFEEDEVEEWEYVDADQNSSVAGHEAVQVETIDAVLDHREVREEPRAEKVKNEGSDRIGEEDDEEDTERNGRASSTDIKLKLEFYVSSEIWQWHARKQDETQLTRLNGRENLIFTIRGKHMMRCEMQEPKDSRK